jgi:peroxiredoxin Q/BCP
VTFVIDRKGVVRMAFSSQIRPKKHVDEALRIVRSLAG